MNEPKHRQKKQLSGNAGPGSSHQQKCDYNSGFRNEFFNRIGQKLSLKTLHFATHRSNRDPTPCLPTRLG
jgi:hypothetical protein